MVSSNAAVRVTAEVSHRIRYVSSGSEGSAASRTGLGPVSAATILGEVADIRRYRSRHAFVAADGTARIPASSGRTARHRLNRSGNRQLDRVLTTIAITQIRADTEGRAYYQRERAEGESGREAIRCLERRLSDVVDQTLCTTTWPPAEPPPRPWDGECGSGRGGRVFTAGASCDRFTVPDLLFAAARPPHPPPARSYARPALTHRSSSRVW